MARVMSFVSTVFIMVPVLAPSIGQGVLAISSWRAIFASLVLIAAGNWVWFAARQPETWPAARRRPFSVRVIARGVAETFRNPITLGYMLECSGRVAKRGRFRDGFVDLDKWARIGSLVAGKDERLGGACFIVRLPL